MSAGGRFTPALSTMKPHGTSPLRSSLMPSTAHSATSGWPARTSSMPPVESLWPGDIDDVVGAAHHVDVAVLILVTGVGRLVVAGKFREITFLEPFVLLPQRRKAGRRQRQLHHDRTDLVRRLQPCRPHRRYRWRNPASARRPSRNAQATRRARPDCRRCTSPFPSATSGRSPAR